jgi:hypothetical protein
VDIEGAKKLIELLEKAEKPMIIGAAVSGSPIQGMT